MTEPKLEESQPGLDLRVPAAPISGLKKFTTPGPFRTAQNDETESINLVRQWQADRTPDAAATMLKSLRPVFDRALRQFVPGSISPTLRAQAKHIALQVLPDYDPERANPESFLRPHLQRLQRIAVQENNIISVPERVLMERQALAQAANNLEDEFGVPPTTQQLADHLGIPIKRIKYIRQAHLPHSESQSIRVGDDGEPYEPAVEQPQTHAAAEFVYDSLDDDRDKFILERSLGLHGLTAANLTSIANQLHITPSAVGQRAQKIQQQIDEIEQAGLF